MCRMTPLGVAQGWENGSDFGRRAKNTALEKRNPMQTTKIAIFSVSQLPLQQGLANNRIIIDPFIVDIRTVFRYNANNHGGKIMENRITTLSELPEKQDRRPNDARPIGEILEELLNQYQARFPGIRIAVVETPVNAL
jgi:hypothetical protein